MKTMKRICLAAIMIGLMIVLIAGLGTTASADALDDTTKKYGALTYYVSNGEVIIKDCDESFVGDLIIPETIEGYPVTKIGIFAINWCPNITSITIPDGVTTIGKSSISWCENLESVTLPDSLTTIGSLAFSNNAKLASVEIPANVSSIGNSAFGMGGLNEITVDPNNMYYSNDEYGVLYNKNKSTMILYPNSNIRSEFIIPDSVTKIADGALSVCINLEKITIPDSVTIIEESAFSSSYNIKSLTIPDSVTIIEDYTFMACNNLVSITIPESVTSIGNRAFSTCLSLTSITIPESVTSIGNRAFEYCSSLTRITINNPDCEIYDSENTIDPVATIYGYKDSTAQSYAEKYGRKFIAVDAVCLHNYEKIVTKATPTKGGKIEYKCSCGDVKSTTTIYYPKTIELSATKYTYTGSAKAPGVTVKDSKGKALIKGTDYTVTYSKEKTNVGKYAVTINFKGNYSGTVTKYFLILPGKTTKITTTTTATTLKAQWNKVTGATGYKVEVINSSGTVVKTVHTKNNYYTFSGLTTALYYKVKVTAYKTIKDVNNYSLVNATTSTYTTPSTPTFSVTSTTKGKANFSWSNVSRETGYQVYYSTSKNGTYSKIGTYAADSKSGSKSSLTSGKTYYFKVRAYKKVGDTVYYSGWSTVKSVKIK